MNFRRYHVSKNLFDWNWLVNGYHLDPQTGLPTTHLMRVSILQPIDVSQLTTAVLSYESVDVQVLYAMYSILTTDNTLIRRVTSVTSGSSLDLSGGDKLYIAFYNGASSSATAITKDNITNIMLNTGSTPQPYEPYSSEVWHDIPHYIMGTDTDTLTTLPAVVYPNDTTATVGLKGNMEQASGASPTTPIQPSECGERTGNQFDYSAITTGYRIQWTNGAPYADDTAIMSDYIPVTEGDYTLNISSIIIGYAADKSYIGVYHSEETWGKFPSDPIPSFTVLSNTNVEFVRLLTYGIYYPITDALMLNEGSTPLPYEPYGYKIPISSASTTTPVYLGEVETTRKIKKLVLDGTKNFSYDATYTRFTLVIPNARFTANRSDETPCTHYQSIHDGRSIDNVPDDSIYVTAGGGNVYINIKDTTYTSLADFKSYLAAQYAAGTPVTVWYVLAEPETGIVNEPIRKIGDYADEVSGISIPTITGANAVDVLTTLKPSEVSVNYHGWHPLQSVHERENGEWD